MGILLSQVDDQGIVSVTWEDLSCALSCGNCELIPGRYYRINYRSTYYLRKGQSPTDFITRGIDIDAPPLYYNFCTDVNTPYGINFIDTNTQAWLGPVEQLLVLATGSNSVDSRVYSEQFPQDEIYWEPLINSTDFIFGNITYRKDSVLNISAHYDWRSIKFRRWNRTLDETIIQPLSLTPAVAQIAVPIEIGPSNTNSENNKFTSWFESDVLMSIGNNMSNFQSPIGFIWDDYFTFGGPVVLQMGLNINTNVEEAANQPSTIPFYFNVPKKFKSISIGKTKQQTICGLGLGVIPDSIASGPCSTEPIWGWESGSGPGSEPCASGSGSGSGSGIDYVDYNYWKERTNIVFLEPTTVYVDGILTTPICENITIADDCLRGTIDGQGCKNINIASGFESNIIISTQPNNDPNYMIGFYETYTDINDSRRFNVKSFISTDFANNIIGYNFKENLIQMPFNGNIIANNFKNNMLIGDAIWYAYEDRPARAFAMNTINGEFSMNEITQIVESCVVKSQFINNKIKALNILPGDNLGRLIESSMISTNIYTNCINTIFTLMDVSQAATTYVGMIGSLSNKILADNISFQSGSTFETTILFPQDVLNPTVLTFDSPSYKSIGNFHILPAVEPTDGDILPLKLINGLYVPDINFNLYPAAYAIKNLAFMMPNGASSEFIKTYNIVDNSIDLLSETDYYFNATPNIISNQPITKPFVDSSNRVWLGYSNGVSMLDAATLVWTTYNTNLDLGGPFSINFIYEDSAKRIWFGHTNGVTVLDGAIWYFITNTMTKIHFSNTDGTDFLNVISILEDNQHRIWLGTNDGGVSLWNNYTLSEIVSNDITKVFAKANKSITIGLNTYTYFADLGSNVTYKVTKIFQDKLGNIFFGTNGCGVSMIPLGIITQSGNDITTSFSIYNTTAANSTRQFSHLSANTIIILDIIEDMYSNVYFSTANGVVKRTTNNIWYVWDNLQWTGLTFVPAAQLPSGFTTVNKIFISNGLWILTDMGISYYTNDVFNIYNTPGIHYTTSADFINSYEDTAGNLWFATNESIGTPSILFYNGTFTLYNTVGIHFPASAGKISAFYQKGNTMYFGSTGCVSQFDGFSWDYYILSANPYEITWIYEDISATNYSDWVLGLSSLQTTNLLSPISTNIVSTGINISLATDLLDLWTKSNDWVQLGKKVFTNDTNAYSLDTVFEVYNANPSDPEMLNYTTYDYTNLTPIDRNDIMSIIETAHTYTTPMSKIHISKNTMDTYKIYPYDIDIALSQYLVDPNDSSLTDYTIVKTTIAGNLTSPVTSLTLVDPGTGFVYQPEVGITGGGGTGAIGKAIVTSGAITAIQVIKAGTGFTSAPLVSITGGSGVSAAITANITSIVSAINIINGGSGYNLAPTITIAGGGGLGATAVAYVAGGMITSIVITNPGSGYTSTPAVIITPNGTGGGANLFVQLDTVVSGFNIINGGSGYIAEPYITITTIAPSEGTGATATVSITNIVDTITLTSGGNSYSNINTTASIIGDGSGAGANVIVNSDININPTASVTDIQLLSSGSGYITNPSVVINGTGVGATAETTITGILTDLTLTNGGSGYKHRPDVVITGTGTGAEIIANVNTAINESNIISLVQNTYNSIDLLYRTALLSKIYLSQIMYDVFVATYGSAVFNTITINPAAINNNEIIVVSISNIDVLSRLELPNDNYKDIELVVKPISDNRIITFSLNTDIEAPEVLYYQTTGQNNYII